MTTVRPRPVNHAARACRATGPDGRHQSVITVWNGENGPKRGQVRPRSGDAGGGGAEAELACHNGQPHPTSGAFRQTACPDPSSTFTIRS
jgi:hypothetical protein